MNESENTRFFPMNHQKEVTFFQSNPSERDKSSLIIKDQNEILNQNHIDNLYEHSEHIEVGSGK
jgi:hypothetical protein